jgi:hypothetical protein
MLYILMKAMPNFRTKLQQIVLIVMWQEKADNE